MHRQTPDGDKDAPPLSTDRVTVAALPREGLAFRLVPDAARLADLAAELSLIGLRKLRFEGRLVPEGGRDWRLDGHLGATVIQPCTVTLEPVTTRVEEPVTRRYLRAWAEPEPGTDIEMPEDDTIEPLGREIDLARAMQEALVLALPLYPRAADAEFGGTAVTAPGQAPMTDEQAKPFAGLSGLRNKLQEPGGDG